MSHTTTIKSVVIRDVAALKKTVLDLQSKGVKCSLVENAVPAMYYNNQVGKCEYVLRLDDALYAGKRYDIGFQKQADGTYATVFDDWGRAISGQVGAACPMPNTPEGKAQHIIGQLLQGYAVNAAINAAVSQGYVVEGHTTDADGNVHLNINVAA